jgi:4-hydroxybutyrate CoA-transferase
MPRTHGYSFIHLDSIDYVVPDVNEPLPIKAHSAPTEVEVKIGKVIAGLVKDGATLQMGIGALSLFDDLDC